MGLFSSRPEEPTEWAGLPSEPARPRAAAESLDTSVESAASLTLWSEAIASVAVPLDARPTTDLETGAGPESTDAEDGDGDPRSTSPGASASTSDSTPRITGA